MAKRIAPDALSPAYAKLPIDDKLGLLSYDGTEFSSPKEATRQLLAALIRLRKEICSGKI